MTKQEREFVRTVRDFYKRHGRAHLPWRNTAKPYQILISEIMLQQTQVERVVPKYRAFIRRWPTVEALAQAPLAEVLAAWQGLGYNRRAKYLHECAKAIVTEHGGVFPAQRAELEKLPGIGPYTAGAVLAFAFAQPVPIIETNIRTVYLHHFFKRKTAVSDRDILAHVERTLPPTRVADWYAALMDYGVHLKRTVGNLNNQQSSAHKKQSTFKGSDRAVRGSIIRCIAEEGSCSFTHLKQRLEFSTDRITVQLSKLQAEGLISRHGRSYRLG